MAYGATYRGLTHRGVDLAANAGDVVSSPVAGTVVFAGSVPADGGGTCNAVTIELASGERISLLPLSQAWVSTGEAVRAADQVGSLSPGGDDSSTQPHLHVSLRRQGAYADPTQFLPGGGERSQTPDAATGSTPPAGSGRSVSATPEDGSEALEGSVGAAEAWHVPSASAAGAAAARTALASSLPMVVADIGSAPLASRQVTRDAGLPAESSLVPMALPATDARHSTSRVWTMAHGRSTGDSVPAIAVAASLAGALVLAIRRRHCLAA